MKELYTNTLPTEKPCNVKLYLKKKGVSKRIDLSLKRLFDIAFSLSALTLGFPILFLIALAIKFTSKGPILYSSLRMGKNREPFRFWKFRSMHEDADERLTLLLKEDTHLNEEWQKYFKLKKDPRLTPIGNFLRKTSLDELPQFWNVLKGDLSLVGPRPYPLGEMEELKSILLEIFPNEANTNQSKLTEKQLDKLFSIRPGLTGIWQTSGRNHLTFKKKVEMHFQYIETGSFFFDLKLILKTIPMFFFPKGAF